MFLKAVERSHGIPFDLELTNSNQDSLDALCEVRENYKNLKSYNSFGEILAEIDREIADKN